MSKWKPEDIGVVRGLKKGRGRVGVFESEKGPGRADRQSQEVRLKYS